MPWGYNIYFRDNLVNTLIFWRITAIPSYSMQLKYINSTRRKSKHNTHIVLIIGSMTLPNIFIRDKIKYDISNDYNLHILHLYSTTLP